jgi:hypothetical protein
MRSLTLLTTSAFIVAIAACAATEDADQLSYRSGRLSSNRGSPPPPGSTEEHDSSDTTGATAKDVGNPNATSSPTAPTSAGVPAYNFALTLGSSTPSVALGEQTTIDVNVEPRNGFNGPVDVSVAGLPDGATADPLTVTPGSPGKLVIKAALTAITTPSGGSSPLVITGRSGSLAATANANFKVAPKLTLTIPMNVDALRAAQIIYRDEYGAAFGSNQQALRTQDGNGIVVTVFNADSKAHVIHGANGFAHGDTGNPIQPNSFELSGANPRTRTFGPGTNANGYPHDGGNGQGASFRIKVVAAP